MVSIPGRRTSFPKRIFLVTDSKKNEKKTWAGTTGAGQNCPERESESLGEDGCMVSSVRSFLVQLFLNSIDRISDALGHAEHVMHLCTCKPCTVCRPITKKKHLSVLLCCRSKHIRYSQQSFSQACTVSVQRSMQAAPPNPSEARAWIVQNVLVQDVAWERLQPRVSRLLQPFPLRSPNGCTECAVLVPVPSPLLVASSLFLAELLSVGRAEARPNMGPHISRVCMSRKISMFIFCSKG